MRVEELLEDIYSPRVSVHMEGVKEEDLEEVAGMLRGLKCSIEGWGSISGMTNDRFINENPLKLHFTSVENAHYFRECVNYYFSDHILEFLRVKRRVYKS